MVVFAVALALLLLTLWVAFTVVLTAIASIDGGDIYFGSAIGWVLWEQSLRAMWKHHFVLH